jgi:anthraniloyl-CoA monooxygenase
MRGRPAARWRACSVQRQASLEWFEATERYTRAAPIPFAFSLLTRSLRVTHEDLRRRDPVFLSQVDDWVAERAREQVGERAPATRRPSPPPMFTPFRLRDLVIPNRVVVSPMCQYKAVDGLVRRLARGSPGSRALGGRGW